MFGLFKYHFRRTAVYCLQHIIDCASRCTKNGIILLHIVSLDKGFSTIPILDWSCFLNKHFKRIPGILSHHNFHFFDKSKVNYRQSSDDKWCTMDLLSGCINEKFSFERPENLHISQLSQERQQYLFKEIRPIVNDPFKDVTCPKP